MGACRWAAAAPLTVAFDRGTPRSVKLATRAAMSAWETQVSEHLFKEVSAWPIADVVIVYDRRWQGPDVVAWTETYWLTPQDRMRHVVSLNAKHYRWRRGDWGRIGRRVALDGVLMHELGHTLGLSDLPWDESEPTMYGRVTPGALSLEAADYNSYASEMRR